MTINASDLLLEVIGKPQATNISTLRGVDCADVYTQARVGDATVHLRLHPDADWLEVRAGLEASGVRVLALKRVTPRAA
jgi:hypothetical protein